MVLDRNRSLGVISALALAVAYGCSSKTSNDTVPATGGGGGYVVDAGASGGSGSGIDPNYCNGLLSGQTCSQTNLQADVRTVNMLLVVDESGSMNQPPIAGGTTTKWSEMTQALQGVLPDYVNDINFGLLLFPFKDGGMSTSTIQDSCTFEVGGPLDVNVPIAAGTQNLDTVTQAVANATPAGGTPTAAALTRALAYFTQGAGKTLKGSKWVLLATDGGPNCDSSITCGADTCTQNLDGNCGSPTGPVFNCCDTSSTGSNPQANLSCLDEAAVLTQIEALKKADVQTYVIGIPGSEAYASTLDKMAVAGGVPNPNGGAHQYYAVSANNALDDLKNALNGIITQLVKTCDITLNTTPSNPSTVQAVQDCNLIPQLTPSTMDGGVGGFYIDYNQSPAHLVLTGSYCNTIMTVGANRLDVIEGCYNPN